MFVEKPVDVWKSNESVVCVRPPVETPTPFAGGTCVQQLQWLRSLCGEVCSRQRDERDVGSKAGLRPRCGGAVKGQAGWPGGAWSAVQKRMWCLCVSPRKHVSLVGFRKQLPGLYCVPELSWVMGMQREQVRCKPCP